MNKGYRSPQHAQMLRAFRAAQADGEHFPTPDEVIFEGSWADLPRTNVGLSQQDKRKIERTKQRRLKHETLDF